MEKTGMEQQIHCFQIQHFSTGDGKGIRTTVFLYTCNLHCPWCHNPEGLFDTPVSMPLEAVVADVMADMDFYRQSHGGVTISGGDPLCRAEECLALLRAFRAEGLHTVVDTALAVRTPLLAEIAQYTDMFLADLKTTDAEKFSAVCGGDLETVYQNLTDLQQMGKDVVLRIPLIPGFNMDESSIAGLVEKAKACGLPITLLPFHRMGAAKYTKLGREYAYAETEPSAPQEIQHIRERFYAAGLREAEI